MKRFTQLILTSFIAILGLSVVALPQPASAIDVFSGACGGDSTDGGNNSETPAEGTPSTGGGGGDAASSELCGATKQDDAQNIIKNVINTILIVLGMIAVIMIVIGGIRYTTSNGDPGSIKGAKDTILYAVVGLVIAILSYAIVNFVIERLS